MNQFVNRSEGSGFAAALVPVLGPTFASSLVPLRREPDAAHMLSSCVYFAGARPPALRLRGVREGRWKLLTRPTEDGLEPEALYDLHEDVSEKFDRQENFPEIARRLLAAAQDMAERIRRERRPLGGAD